MKIIKLYLTLALILFVFTTIAQAPFTPGNFVIVRIGTGSAPLTIDATPVFLDEYTTGGVLVQSVPMPTSVSGANQMFTLSGTANLEGTLSLSANNEFLVLAGYNAAPGLVSPSTQTGTAVPRVVALVKYDGTINTTTAITNLSSTGLIRCATSSNGIDLWAAGSGASSPGIRYATVGSTTSTQIIAGVGYRFLNIAGGQLYASSTGTPRLGTIGAGLPTTASTITALPGFPTSGGPTQFAFADMDAGVAGVDVLYVADETANALRKYSLISGTWTLNGTVGIDEDYRGLCISVSGTNVTIYSTRKGPNTAAGGGEVVTLTDNTGYNGTFSGTPTLIVTAANQTAIRGIAIVPSPPPSAPTNYFRSVQSGNWSSSSTWQSSSDNISWQFSSLAPDNNAQGITIRNHTVTVTSATTIDKTVVNSTGTLIVNSSLTINNSGLKLLSDANSTARIGTSTGTITGNATVERYIANPGHRSWHLLSVPTMGSQTIYDSWQEGGVNNAGYGTLVTSNLYNGSNGFDATSGSASILTHNQGGLSGPSWNYALANTNTTQLSSNPGYMLFVRGDRSYNAGNAPTTSATTLRTTGALRQGTQSAITVSATGTGYTLLGNPYACPIDFESIYTTPNLDQNFFVWDPVLTGNYGLGGYRLVERTGGGTYQQTPVVLGGGPITDPTSRYIHSGQAFFLKATGANANVIFTEASKAGSVSVVNPIVNGPNDQQLIANLMIVNAGNIESLADGIRVRYDGAYQSGTGDDVLKMENFGENLASYREGKTLIAESRPMMGSRDTIFLRMTNTGIKDYRFQVGTLNFTQTNLLAYLQDTYLNTNTLLNLAGGITNKDFSVTADPASAASDRFRIVFMANGPLPVSFTSIKAYQHLNNVHVEWKVANQINIQKYDVEKSTDGSSFNKVTTQTVIGNNGSDATYTWTDINPAIGNNFYRIRSVGIGNEVKYSQVVNVKIGKGYPAISVNPNPIENRTVGLQFTDMPKGIYELRLMNGAGQVVFTTVLTHMGRSGMQTMIISKSIAGGIYHLEITGPDRIKAIKTIVIGD